MKMKKFCITLYFFLNASNFLYLKVFIFIFLEITLLKKNARKR